MTAVQTPEEPVVPCTFPLDDTTNRVCGRRSVALYLAAGGAWRGPRCARHDTDKVRRVARETHIERVQL